MILQNKNAVIYGGGGSLGGAVATALANAGARVFLTGQHISPVNNIAEKIIANGGQAEAIALNALDESAVNRFIDHLVHKAGTIDISFNAISWQDVQGAPLIEMSLQDFIRPITIAMESQFITCTAAGRAMKKQGSGVILTLTATPGGIGYANVGGFGPACCAVESFTRDLASELGPYNIRAVNIRSAGSPDSRPFLEALAHNKDATSEFLGKMKEDTMLKTLPMMEDIGQVATFLASPFASKITGVTIDVTCGTTAALNYKVTPIAFVPKS